MNYYTGVLKKYAVFSGRASRKEYWMFFLFNFIFSIVVSIVGGLLGKVGGNFLSILYTLAVLIPSIAVAARRLHDTGRSGWWLLIGLVPLVGVIVLIIFFVLDSQAGTNAYGGNPKGL